jgi:hypothetical protein
VDGNGDWQEVGVVADPFAPIKGKCLFWREMPNAEDAYDPSVKAERKRIDCSCFVDGDQWPAMRSTIPEDCPKKRNCRYYIKTG